MRAPALPTSSPWRRSLGLAAPLCLSSLALGGCAGPAPTPDAAGGHEDGGALETDTHVLVPDAPGPDAGPSAAADIATVLDCGEPLGVVGTAAPGELQLHSMDTTRFPDALCNDGTAAILYYRPYRGGPENRTRWAITLRGGGSCSGPESCAARWCSCSAARPCDHTDVRTNFTLDNMSGGGRRGNPGNGIHSRDAAHDNPIADYNQVQLVYCSSDMWAGTARSVRMTTTHPRRGDEVTFVAHFLGHEILFSDLALLRHDGAPALVYTADGGTTSMPDLDEATEVLIAGDSGGGAGTIHNVDEIAELLRTHHVGPGTPRVQALVDAIVGPEWSRLDWSMSLGASMGLDTYEEVMSSMQARSWPVSSDASCLAYHAPLGTTSHCLDTSHVVRHHVTTPFFVRMALLDGLISSTYADAGLADPDLGPFTTTPAGVPLVFARVLQRELDAFDQLPSTAEEGASITVAPGVFAPACSNHDTIHEDSEVWGVTIDPGTGPLHLFEVLEPWRRGGTPTEAITTDAMRRDTVCPP
jgi:hypothetical protein